MTLLTKYLEAYSSHNTNNNYRYKTKKIKLAYGLKEFPPN